MEEQKQGAAGESRSETRARQEDGQGWGAQLADSDHHITDGLIIVHDTITAVQMNLLRELGAADSGNQKILPLNSGSYVSSMTWFTIAKSRWAL